MTISRSLAAGPVRLLSWTIAILLVILSSLLPQSSLAAAANPGVNRNAAGGASGNVPDRLLQFTSAGHVLGFDRDSVIITSADHMLKTEFLNSNTVAPQAGDGVSGQPANGAAPALSRVTYPNVWDGVTVVYAACEGSIVESSYYLDPVEGEVPVDRIRIGYNRTVALDGNGNLVVDYGNGTIMEAAPVAWQEIDGQRRPVTAGFVLYGDHAAGFSLENYLPGIPVVIDPPITWTWNTFLGGGGDDHSYGIAVDSNGNVYVSGDSHAAWPDPASPSLPVRDYSSGYDAFAARLGSDGTLEWNTFLGDSGDDHGYGIAVDGDGNVYVSGFSDATWGSPVLPFDITSSGYDAFAARLDDEGNLEWNTFLGGTGDDYGYGIAVDSASVYVCGDSRYTWGTPKRTHKAGYDAFAAKLNSTTGGLQWNTFQGGGGADHSYGIAVDGSGDVYVGGYSKATWQQGSTPPVRAYTDGYDAFASRLNGANGAVKWNTFLGGTRDDVGSGIAVDASGNVYVGGYSEATWQDLVPPVRAFTPNGLNNDGFVARLNGTDGVLQWNTFLGDSGDDFGGGIAVNGSGVSFGGFSETTWQQGSTPPVRAFTDNGTNNDGFVARLNDVTGDLQWNTFLGGDGDDYGGGIAVDGGGNVCFGGYSNASWSSPVRAFTSGGTNNDGFAVKLDSNGYLAPSITSGTIAADNSYIDVVFSEGVYGAADGSTPLTAGKLALKFVRNGGNATNVVIASVTNTGGGALTGGKTTVRVHLTVTGIPSGVETIEIKPAGSNSVYDKDYHAASEDETTGAQTLNDQRADLVIIKTDSSDPVLAGGRLTYIITVTNLGTGEANNITVSETYPADFSYITASPVPNSGSDLWIFPSLAANASQTIAIEGKVTAISGSLTNTASVTSSTDEVSLANNTTSQSTDIYVLKGVGGEVKGIDKLNLIIPWLALALLLTASGVFFVLKRRKGS